MGHSPGVLASRVSEQKSPLFGDFRNGVTNKMMNFSENWSLFQQRTLVSVTDNPAT